MYLTYNQLISHSSFYGSNKKESIAIKNFYNTLYGIRNNILLINTAHTILSYKRALTFITKIAIKKYTIFLFYTKEDNLIYTISNQIFFEINQQCIFYEFSGHLIKILKKKKKYQIVSF